MAAVLQAVLPACQYELSLLKVILPQRISTLFPVFDTMSKIYRNESATEL